MLSVRGRTPPSAKAVFIAAGWPVWGTVGVQALLFAGKGRTWNFDAGPVIKAPKTGWKLSAQSQRADMWPRRGTVSEKHEANFSPSRTVCEVPAGNEPPSRASPSQGGR